MSIKIIIYFILLTILCFLVYFIYKKYFKEEKIRYYGEKWIGKRKDQEDSFAILNNENIIVAILADGMGGHLKGTIASQYAVDRYLEIYKYNKEYEDEDMIKMINNELVNYSSRLNQKNNIGTTFIKATLTENKFSWLSVGDSYIYRYRRGSIEMLNKLHLKGKYLTSYLGYEDFNEYDKGEIAVNKDEIFIISSDGLDNISLDELKKMIHELRNKNSKYIVDYLLNHLKDKDKPNQDNVSVICLKN